MRNPLVLILALICGLVILGLATLHQSILILAMPLIVYLCSAIYSRPEHLDLSISREVFPPYAAAGKPITVKLTVTNEGAAIDELLIQDILPEGIQQIDGRSTALICLDSYGKIGLEYVVIANRGDYSNYAVSVTARDFSHLFELPLVFRTNPGLTVSPHYSKLKRVKIRPPQTRGFAGPIAARQGGSGIGFWGVREYQSGDPRRRINWKLSARSDEELFTNIFEQERIADVGLILDARQQVDVTSASGSLFEHAVSAAAALAETFLNDGNRVSLFVYGSGLVRIFPGYGRLHRDRILKTLAKARPELNYALESLNYLPTRFFPAKSQIVMVSPLLPADASVLTRIRSYGYAMMIISPDPVAYSATAYQDFSSWAYRMAYAERNLMLNEVRRSGIQLVNWNVAQPLDVAIKEGLAHGRQRL